MTSRSKFHIVKQVIPAIEGEHDYNGHAITERVQWNIMYSPYPQFKLELGRFVEGHRTRKMARMMMSVYKNL